MEVDAVAIDDRCDRIEESEAVRARGGADACRKAGGGERPGGADREALGGQRVDLLAPARDVGLRGARPADAGRTAAPTDPEGGAPGHLVDAPLPQTPHPQPDPP